MNPIIRGQAHYFRPGASKKAYQALDDHLWQHLYKWARRRHPNKSRRWVTARYFGQFTRPGATSGSSVTTTAAPTSTTTPGQRSSGTSRSPAGTHPTTLPSPSTGPTGGANANPRRSQKPGNASYVPSTGTAPCAGNRCCYTDRLPDSLTQWETWYTAIRKAMTHQAIAERDSGRTTSRLVHAHCTRRHPGDRTHSTDP